MGNNQPMESAQKSYRTNRKWEIICPVAAILLTAVIFAVIHFRNEQRGLRLMMAQQIGEDLIASKDSKFVVRVGDGLRAKLSEYTAGHAKVTDVRVGDDPSPIGNGSASNCVILSNDAGGVLSIRLKPAGNGKFHILGFVTLPNGAPREARLRK
jgi:hypothetical protein